MSVSSTAEPSWHMRRFRRQGELCGGGGTRRGRYTNAYRMSIKSAVPEGRPKSCPTVLLRRMQTKFFRDRALFCVFSVGECRLGYRRRCVRGETVAAVDVTDCHVGRRRRWRSGGVWLGLSVFGPATSWWFIAPKRHTALIRDSLFDRGGRLTHPKCRRWVPPGGSSRGPEPFPQTHQRVGSVGVQVHRQEVLRTDRCRSQRLWRARQLRFPSSLDGRLRWRCEGLSGCTSRNV